MDELGRALVGLLFRAACSYATFMHVVSLMQDASADASLTRDGRILVISNMLTGFELFALKGLVELEPLFCFKQDVLGGPCLPVRFLHGDHAIIGGCVYGHVNLWDIYSRGKHVLNVGGMRGCLRLAL